MNILELELPKAKFPQCRGWNGARTKLSVDNKPPKILFFYNNSNATIKYPVIYRLLKDIHQEYFSDFEYDVIQINYNVRMARHLDKKNNGDTVIFTLGKFTDGRLIIEDKKFDCYKNPVRFCGSRQYHATEEFTGERYSVIYYKNSGVANRLNRKGYQRVASP
jgi:hypothetical protein